MNDIIEVIKDYEITENNAEAVEKLEAAGQAFEDAGNEDYAGDIQDALEELMDGNVRKADDLLSDLKIKIIILINIKQNCLNFL